MVLLAILSIALPILSGCTAHSATSDPQYYYNMGFVDGSKGITPDPGLSKNQDYNRGYAEGIKQGRNSGSGNATTIRTPSGAWTQSKYAISRDLADRTYRSVKYRLEKSNSDYAEKVGPLSLKYNIGKAVVKITLDTNSRLLVVEAPKSKTPGRIAFSLDEIDDWDEIYNTTMGNSGPKSLPIMYQGDLKALGISGEVSDNFFELFFKDKVVRQVAPGRFEDPISRAKIVGTLIVP